MPACAITTSARRMCSCTSLGRMLTWASRPCIASRISAQSPSPAASAIMANGYGEAYSAFRAALDRGAIQSAINTLDHSLAALSPSERAGSVGDSMRAQLGTLQLANSLEDGDAVVVRPASAPTNPSSPRLKRNVVLAVILALILVLGLACARTQRAPCWERNRAEVAGGSTTGGGPLSPRRPSRALSPRECMSIQGP
jgi:hypothetical protein